jgi:hypothetical protein
MVTVHSQDHSNDKTCISTDYFSVGSRYSFNCFREHQAWCIITCLSDLRFFHQYGLLGYKADSSPVWINVEKCCFESRPELYTGPRFHYFLMCKFKPKSMSISSLHVSHMTHWEEKSTFRNHFQKYWIAIRVSSVLFGRNPILFLFAAYLLDLLLDCEDGGITFLRIVDKLSPRYAASNFRRRHLKYHTSFHFRTAVEGCLWNVNTYRVFVVPDH